MTTPISLFAGPTPSQAVATHLQTLTGAAAELRALTMAHAARISAIRTEVSHDPNLTAEGRQNQLRERTAAACEQGRATLEGLKARVATAERLLGEAIEARWPKPMTGVEGMLSRQAAWARSRSLLESGLSVSALLAETDDLETLFALREELPTWVRTRGADADHVEQVLERIELRMGKIGTKNGQGEVDLMAKFEARAVMARLRPMLGNAEVEFAGHEVYATRLNAAVASHFAGKAVEAANQPIIGPDGSVL